MAGKAPSGLPIAAAAAAADAAAATTKSWRLARQKYLRITAG